VIEEGVAQRPQEIAEVVLVAEQTGTREHLRVGFLNEVLGILARPRQRPRGAVQPIRVIAKPSGVE